MIVLKISSSKQLLLIKKILHTRVYFSRQLSMDQTFITVVCDYKVQKRIVKLNQIPLVKFLWAKSFIMTKLQQEKSYKKYLFCRALCISSLVSSSLLRIAYKVLRLQRFGPLLVFRFDTDKTKIYNLLSRFLKVR